MDDITERIDLLLLEIQFKKVVRKGKIIRKPICPAGFKAVGKKCVKMTQAEKRKRSKASKRSQKKIQASGKKALLIKKRAKSMRKRTALIPSTQPPKLEIGK
jgi:hypothetical protein